MDTLQSCSRILLDDKSCIENLKKMRRPNMDALRKVELMKSIVKKCNTLANKPCRRCGYINGLSFCLFLWQDILYWYYDFVVTWTERKLSCSMLITMITLLQCYKFCAFYFLRLTFTLDKKWLTQILYIFFSFTLVHSPFYN